MLALESAVLELISKIYLDQDVAVEISSVLSVSDSESTYYIPRSNSIPGYQKRRNHLHRSSVIDGTT